MMSYNTTELPTSPFPLEPISSLWKMMTTGWARVDDFQSVGVTDRQPWQSASGAGLNELHWFENNVERLEAYQGQWIAILGEKVIAFGSSISEVRSQLIEANVHDALVVRVPHDVMRREYFIG